MIVKDLSRLSRNYTDAGNLIEFDMGKDITEINKDTFRQFIEGEFATAGTYSKDEMYYLRVIRYLAEYYSFGVLFRRHDFHGEIIWPE